MLFSIPIGQGSFHGHIAVPSRNGELLISVKYLLIERWPCRDILALTDGARPSDNSL